MPMIATRGGGSVRGFGRFGGAGGGLIRAAILTALGSTDYTWSGSTITVDLRSFASEPGSLTVYASGGRGGNHSGGGGTGGAGAYLVGTVPFSALAGKIIGFVGGGNGGSTSDGRGSCGGGGFSGIIQLDNTLFSQLKTTTHIFSAAGGSGGTGPGDNGLPKNGVSSTSIVYSGSPSGGSGGLAKNQAGTTGFYPSLSYAARPGNAWGGGDGCSNAEGNTDNFPSGGGGGYGPLPGFKPDNASGPGVLGGNPLAGDYGTGTTTTGGYGGGGSGGAGSSGGVPWRVCSGSGGGGGFQGGAGGSYTSDAVPGAGTAGVSYSADSGWVSTFTGGGSSNGQLRIVLTP